MRSSVQSENPQQSNSEISAVLAKKWKEVSNDVRQSYQKMAKKECVFTKSRLAGLLHFFCLNSQGSSLSRQKKHEADQQRKQREEMAMKLVDPDVTMVPYEQCNYENFLI